MIWEDLDESLIFTEMRAQNWREILQRAGTAMQQNGYAKKTYVQALIDRESRYPTGIDMGETGVAIPHTDISEIKKEGIAVVILKDPVAFGQMGTEKDTVMVKIVLILAIKESGSQVENLKQIMGVIQDKDVLHRLKNARDCQSVIDIIRQKEESL